MFLTVFFWSDFLQNLIHILNNKTESMKNQPIATDKKSYDEEYLSIFNVIQKEIQSANKKTKYGSNNKFIMVHTFI